MSASILKTSTEMIYFLFYQAPMLQENTSQKLVQFTVPTVSLCIYTKSCTLQHSAPLFKENWTTQWACWSAILEWGSLRGPCKCKASNICVKSGQKGCFCMWGIGLQRQVLADKLGQYQREETESGGLLSCAKNNELVCAHNNADDEHQRKRSWEGRCWGTEQVQRHQQIIKN